MNPNRRRLLGALMTSPALLCAPLRATPAQPVPQTLFFPPEGGFPNSVWPVLFYRQALPADTPDLAAAFEARFQAHGWPPQWRYGMYPFDHFHSTAHEALGVFRGQATVRLGGPQGRALQVSAGDVLVLPAGTSHRALRSSPDFCMVGAYPRGQQWDMQRGDPAKLEAVRAAIARVPRPPQDPLGTPLDRLWPLSGGHPVA